MTTSVCVLMQLYKAQEVKVNVTQDTWQQEMCDRFHHPFPTTDSLAAASEADPGSALDRAGRSQIALDGIHDPEGSYSSAEAVLGGAPNRAGQRQTAPDDYWQLTPGVRLTMLRSLCHAALNTYIFR